MVRTAHLSHEGMRFQIPNRPSGRHARELRSHVRRALEGGERHLVVDCHAWEEFDFQTLSSLIQCAADCRAHGASFEVTSMSTRLQDEVRELRLHDRLGIPA